MRKKNIDRTESVEVCLGEKSDAIFENGEDYSVEGCLLSEGMVQGRKAKRGAEEGRVRGQAKTPTRDGRARGDSKESIIQRRARRRRRLKRLTSEIARSVGLDTEVMKIVLGKEVRRRG